MTLPESLWAEMEEKATRIANEAAMPILRDMYPTRSRGQMANEFRHFILTGVQAVLDLQVETVSPDVEKAAKEYAVRTAVITPGSFDTCEAIDAFKAGDAHGYARAKGEIDRSKNGERMRWQPVIAEAVKAERERCAAIVLGMVPRPFHDMILSPSEKEGEK